MNARHYFLALSALFFSFTALAEIKIHEIQNATSATACDGKISIVIDGNSNGPYEISLMQGSKTIVVLANKENGVHTFDGRCVGDYTIKVINKNTKLGGTGLPANCEKILTASIGLCTDIAIGIQKSTLVCDGSKDGFIDITPQGGTPPYKYAWNIGKTTEDLNNLDGEKAYKVTVTDDQGCKAIREIKVDGQKINTNLEVLKGSNTCQGEISLSALVTGTPGTLTYEWSMNPIPEKSTSKPNLYTKLCLGYHKVVLKTAQGCSVTLPFRVEGCNTSRPLTAYSFDMQNHNLSDQYCNMNSYIGVHFYGGTAPLRYEFKDNQGNIMLYNKHVGNGGFNVRLPAPQMRYPMGHYIFKVTDMCGVEVVEDFHCDCTLAEEDFFEMFNFETVQPCNVQSGESKLSLLEVVDGGINTNLSPNVFPRNYAIDWGTHKTEILNYRVDQNSMYGQTFTQNGPSKIPIASEELRVVKIKDSYGCKYEELCAEFTNLAIQGCAFKTEMLSKIPESSKYGIEALWYNNKVSYGIDMSLKCLMIDKSSCDKLGKRRIEVYPKAEIKKFEYTPYNPYKPCEGGSINIPSSCFNNKSIDLVPGKHPNMYVNWNIRTYGSEEGICEYKCACIYDNGSFSSPVYVDNVAYLVDDPSCTSPQGWENEIFRPSTNTSSSNSCQSYDRSNCSGGKRSYRGITSYNDCFFDVTCPDDNGNPILIYENCPFRFTCCFDYDKVAAIDPTKIPSFPIDKQLSLGTGQTDLVKFCRWAHPKGKDPTKNHIVEILPSDCNPTFKSCFDVFSSKIGKGSSNELPELKFKFLRTDEAYAEVYPNPFEQTIDFRLYHNKGNVLNIVLYDVLGRLIQTKEIDAINGNISFSMNVKDQLPKGMYIVLLEGEGFRLQYPLVHQ